MSLTDQPRPMNFYLNPVRMVRTLWSHRGLTWQFASRRIQARYKGQALGVGWSLLEPLVTLAIYTFVFGIIFQRVAEAGAGSDGGIARFALEVFAGILIFGIFRETVGAAPTLVVGQANFVKKVVYPLETLVVSQLLVALFSAGVGLLVWLLGYLIFSESHIPSPGLLLLPVIVLPVALLSLGISWALASLGVFIRDLRSSIGSVLHMLFFLTPIFYTLDQVPERYRGIIAANPLAQAVQGARAVMFGDGSPDWQAWAMTTAAGALVCILGYAFFMKSRRAFADVI